MGVNQSAKRKHHIKDDEEVNFDHFQILRAIGKGSFGKVCIVQKKDTGQMYAMKYMSKAACFEKDALRNVLREIEILTQLDHPGLVNLWFSFHDEEDMFLVQDLLLGGDLRYHLMQNGSFPLPAVKLYVAELGLALDYLQQKGIIHRDIKPDNILLDEQGHAHITDFNVATKLEDGKKLATSISGTKPYMAPEIFSCALDEIPGYEYAVDWWSLGIVTYELAAGRRPFEIHSSTPNKEVKLIHNATTPKFPSAWPPEFIELVKALLQVDALTRLRSLEHLQDQPMMKDINFDDVMEMKPTPVFVPPKGHLNCDPTFELEEMIVESKPLHKKKKRLAKQRSLREIQSSPSTEQQEFNLDPLAEEFIPFNRQKELDRQERERKEQEWERELLEAMELSGSLSCNSSSTPKLFEEPTSSSGSPGPSSSSTATGTIIRGVVGTSGGGVGSPTSNNNKPLSAVDSKKAAWSKRRSITMPEGDKVWRKSKP